MHLHCLNIHNSYPLHAHYAKCAQSQVNPARIVEQMCALNADSGAFHVGLFAALHAKQYASTAASIYACVAHQIV